MKLKVLIYDFHSVTRPSIASVTDRAFLLIIAAPGVTIFYFSLLNKFTLCLYQSQYYLILYCNLQPY